MDEKNFVAQLLDALKKNSFAVKKILLNLDDCVSQKEFDALNEELRQAQRLADELQQTKTRLESDLAAAQVKLRNLDGEVSEQREELRRREKTLQRLREDNSRLSNDLSETRQEVQKLSRRLADFESNYSELEAAYKSYLQLPDSMQFALAGVFGKKNSPVSFLAGALQEGHLESLFDFAAQAVNQGKSQAELNILRELLDFTFQAVNNGRREEIYRRLDVQNGDDFDRETMRKTSTSRQSGTVHEIFLRGFKYATSGKVVRQSLISLA